MKTLVTIGATIGHDREMKDEFKLVTAFLVLNLSVVALAIVGYQKSGMRFSAVLSHLTG